MVDVTLVVYLGVMLVSCPIMKWAGYGWDGAVVFSFCSPLVFAVASGPFVLLSAPVSMRVYQQLLKVEWFDWLTESEIELIISAILFLVGLRYVAKLMRKEDGVSA
ncbi:hypothetical protein [Lentimonas sp. CC10]|uniref:hypothetical protein n=2 Tax=Lentimonas TaxID=417293 RepID=UPI001322E4BE|nr:hypothetical protein [Lentimonas sp. CC10]CAA6689609.1 Unannotated [Lentimonas sp. CC19]CAA6692593.1 Unannotated [Lentimonas sp. CC10]CAA7069209.1 Unannotated [Lentimonas sp. CC11]